MKKWNKRSVIVIILSLTAAATLIYMCFLIATDEGEAQFIGSSELEVVKIEAYSNFDDPANRDNSCKLGYFLVFKPAIEAKGKKFEKIFIPSGASGAQNILIILLHPTHKYKINFHMLKVTNDELKMVEISAFSIQKM